MQNTSDPIAAIFGVSARPISYSKGIGDRLLVNAAVTKLTPVKTLRISGCDLVPLRGEESSYRATRSILSSLAEVLVISIPW